MIELLPLMSGYGTSLHEPPWEIESGFRGAAEVP